MYFSTFHFCWSEHVFTCYCEANVMHVAFYLLFKITKLLCYCVFSENDCFWLKCKKFQMRHQQHQKMDPFPALLTYLDKENLTTLHELHYGRTECCTAMDMSIIIHLLLPFLDPSIESGYEAISIWKLPAVYYGKFV